MIHAGDDAGPSSNRKPLRHNLDGGATATSGSGVQWDFVARNGLREATRGPNAIGRAHRPIDVEAEFERFVADLIPMAPHPNPRLATAHGASARPQPRTSTATICRRALALLDAEGAGALTVRRLAAELKISTRTLYKRISSYDNLVRKVVELHFASITVDFCEGDAWEETAWNWCEALHARLCAHPHLTGLMTEGDVSLLGGDVDALAEAATREGVSPRIAIECYRSLADVTVNHAIRDVRAMHHAGDVAPTSATTLESVASLRRTVEWILVGVRAESSRDGGDGGRQ